MKKILAILIAFFFLSGCEKADHTGSYSLFHKENCTYIIVHWEYPNGDMNFSTFELVLDNLDPYIDKSAPVDGSGIVLNKLLGNLGFNRSFLHHRPIHIYEEDIETIIRKNIKIYLDFYDQDGNNYLVELKYDKSLKE